MPPAGKDKKKVIIKKKGGGGHAGHHGGSWKVAYADFVTAMMAFFMVMWIVGMDDSAKESIQGYFSNPVGFKKGFGSGSSPMGSGNTPVLGMRESPMPARMAEEAAMESTRERLQAALDQSDLGGLEGNIDVRMTSEGLRIEFGEGLIGDATFASGSSVMTEPMLRAIAILGAEIAVLPNAVIIEGHTDGVPLVRAGGYSNWELSSDRANAARRALLTQGVTPDRVVSVRGMADRSPKIVDFPLDPRNRRISVLLPFRTAGPGGPEQTPSDVAAAPVP
ncbi:MAG: OmpA family protein [Gemmatimonadetes bacterium]|nr:OmpA family protein [Gemmatimonadota bacterium]